MLNNKLILFLVVGLLSLHFALAEDVTFKLVVPNEDTIKVGDTFDVQVVLDIDYAVKAIKQAEFTLTPGAGVTFVGKSAVSGNLFPGATVTFNTLVGTGYKYGETNTQTEVSGAGKVFVTLQAKAVSQGDVTFTFSGVVAKKGNFARTTTSLSKTIVVKSGTCTPSCPLPSTVCQGTTNTQSNGCGGSCNVVGTKTTGECAAGSCKDHDVGDTAYTTSSYVTSTDGGDQYDGCYPPVGGLLKEFYCDGDIAKPEDVDCSVIIPGTVCSSGACVVPEACTSADWQVLWEGSCVVEENSCVKYSTIQKKVGVVCAGETGKPNTAKTTCKPEVCGLPPAEGDEGTLGVLKEHIGNEIKEEAAAQGKSGNEKPTANLSLLSKIAKLIRDFFS